MFVYSIRWLLHQEEGTLSQNDLQTYLISISFATSMTANIKLT